MNTSDIIYSKNNFGVENNLEKVLKIATFKPNVYRIVVCGNRIKASYKNSNRDSQTVIFVLDLEKEAENIISYLYDGKNKNDLIYLVSPSMKYYCFEKTISIIKTTGCKRYYHEDISI